MKISNTYKYGVEITKNFDKSYKKIVKQGKDVNKLKDVISKLANKETLEQKYHNHKLNDNKEYNNCFECHIEPDWLLIYKYVEDKLILLLVNTGSHSNLF